MAGTRLTVIGLDSATFDVIDPLIEAGELPNLKNLFESGTRGTLHSTLPPITSQAWATIFTGVNAGRHGLWDFTERDATGYRLRLVNGSFRRVPTVWNYLSARGHAVGVVNVPFTWPATEVNGFLLAGLDSAGRGHGMAYPPGLADELERRFGALQFDHMAPVDANGEIDLERVRRECEQKVETTLYMTDRYEPDLLVAVFMAIDHAQHYGWTEWEELGAASRLAEVYRIADSAVGALAETTGAEGSILVLSDHGGGRLEGVINLNAWLAAEGFFAYADPLHVMRSLELPRIAMLKLLEQRRRLPRRLRTFLKEHRPELRERLHEYKEFTIVDWQKTKAFAYGYMGNVVLNVRGRERHGIVEPGREYERVREEIAERALALRDPETGDQIITAVHKREDLFFGPALSKIPDLVFEFKDWAWAGKGNLRSRTPTFQETLTISGSDQHIVGSHRADGFLALSGHAVRERGTVDARCEDVASTIMYLMGEPVPSEFEGRILEEALANESLENRPPTYEDFPELELQHVQTYAADDAAAVEERLRGLGYLE